MLIKITSDFQRSCDIFELTFSVNFSLFRGIASNSSILWQCSSVNLLFLCHALSYIAAVSGSIFHFGLSFLFFWNRLCAWESCSVHSPGCVCTETPCHSQAVDVMTQMDYKYSLLESTVDDYRKRPLLLQVDDTPMNLFAVLEVKEKLPKRWSTMECFGKIRLYSILFGLAIMFFIMASYILTGDKKGLLLTPSPFHYSSLVSPGPFAFNLSSVKNYAHIKLVVKSITSKVDFHSSRHLPEIKALVNSELHVSTVKIHSKVWFCYQVDCLNEYLRVC